MYVRMFVCVCVRMLVAMYVHAWLWRWRLCVCVRVCVCESEVIMAPSVGRKRTHSREIQTGFREEDRFGTTCLYCSERQLGREGSTIFLFGVCAL